MPVRRYRREFLGFLNTAVQTVKGPILCALSMNCLVFLFFLVWPLVVLSQDLQFECITCADKFDKCELDCAWSLVAESLDTIVACQSDCQTTLDNCVDTDEAIACLACTTSCAATYDTSMRKCLAATGRTMRTTKSLSDCEYDANKVMDPCMAACSTHSY